jgi:hypothetical protein
MALGSTQPLAEMSTRIIPGVKGLPALKADNLTAICKPNIYKMWEPRRLSTLWASMVLTGMDLPCYREIRAQPHVNSRQIRGE